MKFEPTMIQDVSTIYNWILADPYHWDSPLGPEWWVTGNGYLSYLVSDDQGTVFYMRTDKDGDFLRLNTQFAPEDVVSKRRVAPAIIFMLDRMKILARHENFKGLIYQSTSPSLINFVAKQGFEAVDNNDYLLRI